MNPDIETNALAGVPALAALAVLPDALATPEVKGAEQDLADEIRRLREEGANVAQCLWPSSDATPQDREGAERIQTRRIDLYNARARIVGPLWDRYVAQLNMGAYASLCAKECALEIKMDNAYERWENTPDDTPLVEGEHIDAPRYRGAPRREFVIWEIYSFQYHLLHAVLLEERLLGQARQWADKRAPGEIRALADSQPLRDAPDVRRRFRDHADTLRRLYAEEQVRDVEQGIRRSHNARCEAVSKTFGDEHAESFVHTYGCPQEDAYPNSRTVSNYVNRES